MPGFTRRHLALLVIPLLALTLLSCKRESYPGAPEGYNYKTLQVKWKYEGEKTGTREFYLETKGYEDGQLIYKRLADIRDTVAKNPARPDQPVTDDGWFFNVEGKNHVVLRQLSMAGISNMQIAPLIRSQRMGFWLPVLRYLFRREDMTMEKRAELQSRLANITDEDLTELGGTVDEEDFMGHRVKHYVLPVADGKAEVWMYGDIVLKTQLESRWRGMEVKNSVEPTEFKVNEKLPEKVFTIPEGFKIVDKSKPIEAH